MKKYIQNVKDGPGWSPDGGHFIAKDNIVYWRDGDVSDMNEGGVIRILADSTEKTIPKSDLIIEILPVKSIKNIEIDHIYIPLSEKQAEKYAEGVEDPYWVIKATYEDPQSEQMGIRTLVLLEKAYGVLRDIYESMEEYEDTGSSECLFCRKELITTDDRELLEFIKNHLEE